MTDSKASGKKRILRRAEESMRDRAERAKQGKVKRKFRISVKPPKFITKLAGLTIWKPFKWVLKLLFPKYLRNSFKELRRVTWPNGKQTRQLTGAVILFSITFGLLVAVFDYGLDKLFKQVIIR